MDSTEERRHGELDDTSQVVESFFHSEWHRHRKNAWNVGNLKILNDVLKANKQDGGAEVGFMCPRLLSSKDLGIAWEWTLPSNSLREGP